LDLEKDNRKIFTEIEKNDPFFTMFEVKESDEVIILSISIEINVVLKKQEERLMNCYPLQRRILEL